MKNIRVWGTIGWIAAGCLLTLWRIGAKSLEAIAVQGDMLLLAGIFSLAMGLQSFTLPHTPPKKEGVKPWAFLEALRMMKPKNFLVFIIIAFVVATELWSLTRPLTPSGSVLRTTRGWRLWKSLSMLRRKAHRRDDDIVVLRWSWVAPDHGAPGAGVCPPD